MTRLIRNCFLGFLVVFAMFMVATGSSHAAAPRWPASCHTWRCVNRHLNQVHAELAATRARQAAMFTCLFHLPAEWVEQTTNPYLSLADPASPGQPGLYAFVQRTPSCSL